MFSPTIIPSLPPTPSPTPIPRLKIKHLRDALHLGDSMKIVGMTEKGYMAQLNGSELEVLLVATTPVPSPSPRRRAEGEGEGQGDSPPSSSRSLPSSSSSRRSHSLPSPSRSQSQPSPSRTFEDIDLKLSPRTSSSPSLPITTLKARGMTSKQQGSERTSSPRSTPTSPRACSSPNSLTHVLSPPNPPSTRSPPRQRRSREKPLVQLTMQRSPSYNYYPVQGWVLWRRTIGQWERVWMASKKSPTRVCFYSSENEDSEEREAIKVEDLKSLWAPEESEKPQKIAHTMHFRLFTERKTIYLIVPSVEKMRYWIAGLRKLNPDMEVDVRDTVHPASPLSPRPNSKFVDSGSFQDDMYTTDDEMDGWD